MYIHPKMASDIADSITQGAEGATGQMEPAESELPEQDLHYHEMAKGMIRAMKSDDHEALSRNLKAFVTSHMAESPEEQPSDEEGPED